MSDLLKKQNEIRNTLDIKTNIVIGFNSAAVVIFFTKFQELIQYPIFLLILAVLLTSLICAILALKPPHLLTKKGQEESLFYHNHIDSMSYEAYKTEVHNALEHEYRIYDAYIKETYNLTRFSNVPRKKYLYLSIRVLIYGIGLSIAVYLFTALIGWLIK